MCDLTNCNYDDLVFIDKNIYDTVFNWDGERINILTRRAADYYELYGYRGMECSMYQDVFRYVTQVMMHECKVVEDERPMKERRCSYMRVALTWLKYQANEFELGNVPV